MAEELSRAGGAWSVRTGESRLEGDFVPQWGMRLLCILLCPCVPILACLGILWAAGVPAMLVAIITGVLLIIPCGAVSAWLRIKLSSGSTYVDGVSLHYTGDMRTILLTHLKTGLLSLVTLGFYWILGFSAVDTSKVRYRNTVREGSRLSDRSGFIGNFLHILFSKILIVGVPITLMCMTGLIPIREHSELFYSMNASKPDQFPLPTMNLWGLLKALVRNGFSAFGDKTFYNEVTTLIWTAIMLFVALFIMLPWYRHKMLKWEASHAVVDGYQLKFTATFGQYVGNAYTSLLMAAVPSVLLVILCINRSKMAPALGIVLILLMTLAILAVLTFCSYRSANFRAQHTTVLAPPTAQASWDDYMVSAETLNMTLSESVKAMFSPAERRKVANYAKRYWTLYLLLLVPVVYLIIFKYIPMVFIQIGIKQNNIVLPIWDVPWGSNYGFEWFINAFQSSDFINSLRNTMMLNGLDILVGFPAPIILALLLNELTFRRFKRVAQTIFYMPHFLSWVIIAALAMQLFNGTDGLINMVLAKLGMDPTLPFEQTSQWVTMFVLIGVWQGAGWGTIIYLAAITGINPELYEAASVDGAGRMRKMWHITLPGIRPTIIVLLIMRMGSIIGSDFERPFALRNPLITKVSDVLSIYVYQYGLKGTKFSLTSAVGIFQSVICLIFLFAANALAKKFGERGVW